MLKLITPLIMLIALTWLSNKNMMWMNVTSYSSLISLMSLGTLNQCDNTSSNFSLTFFLIPYQQLY